MKNIVYTLAVFFLSLFLASKTACTSPKIFAQGLNDNREVRYIIDGDTFITKKGEHIRLIGINAPELGKENQRPEPFSIEARSRLQELIGNKAVAIFFDKEKYDTYKRVLAYVYLNKDLFINQLLIEEGTAYVLFSKPNLTQYELLLKSQKTAMEKRKGIWSILYPANNSKVPYRGVIGSRRFHSMSCLLGQKANPKNQKIFESHWNGFNEGYAPAKCCLNHLDKIIQHP